MKNSSLINYKAVSLILTGSDRKVRKTGTAKKYVDAIKELDDLIEYWKKRNGID